MEKRYEVRRRELLAGCEVKPALFDGVRGRLREFMEPFAECLWRAEQKDHARQYVEGLLSDLESKNAESIAYLHGLGRKAIQHFLGESAWDHEPLVDELVRQVAAGIGEADGVLVIDPSAHGKKGNGSVGVKPQWNGRRGKIDNCQVGIYLAYASRKEHVLVDERLFLPREWADDRRRREKCGVARDVRFRTRHELALEMLRAHRKRLPHAWVAAEGQAALKARPALAGVGDDEMGRSARFRASLRAMRETYLLAVPSNTRVRDLEGRAPTWSGVGRPPKCPLEQAQKWAARQPAKAWTEIEVRLGEKGPVVVECLKRRVHALTHERRNGPEELLFVTRERVGDKMKHDYFLSNAKPETALRELARVARAEHRVEECFQRAKGEAGLSDYEVRTWRGWHHHQVLTFLATWFLTRHASWGKKGDAGNHRPADQGGDRVAAA
jgi:SRSO17 transposase